MFCCFLLTFFLHTARLYPPPVDLPVYPLPIPPVNLPRITLLFLKTLSLTSPPSWTLPPWADVALLCLYPGTYSDRRHTHSALPRPPAHMATASSWCNREEDEGAAHPPESGAAVRRCPWGDQNGGHHPAEVPGELLRDRGDDHEGRRGFRARDSSLVYYNEKVPLISTHETRLLDLSRDNSWPKL